MCLLLKAIFISIFTGLCSFAANAETNQNADSFLTFCINSWLKKADKSVDQVDYKNFGEKYCSCAATQPLNDEAAINKALQLCLSRTLLHDVMDSLEEETSLAEAKDSDIKENCQDRWNLIYPHQTGQDLKATTAYCDCALPKLLELIKQSENITDKKYDESIDNVAMLCSGDIPENK